MERSNLEFNIDVNLLQNCDDIFVNLLPFLESYELRRQMDRPYAILKTQYILRSISSDDLFTQMEKVYYNKRDCKYIIDHFQVSTHINSARLESLIGFFDRRIEQDNYLELEVQWIMSTSNPVNLSYTLEQVHRKELEQMSEIDSLKFKIEKIGNKDIILL